MKIGPNRTPEIGINKAAVQKPTSKIPQKCLCDGGLDHTVTFYPQTFIAISVG